LERPTDAPRPTLSRWLEEEGVEKEQKQALQVAKEIVVKFIEVGRVTPSNFAEIFPQVYQEVLRAVETAESGSQAAEKREQKGS